MNERKTIAVIVAAVVTLTVGAFIISTNPARADPGDDDGPHSVKWFSHGRERLYHIWSDGQIDWYWTDYQDDECTPWTLGGVWVGPSDRHSVVIDAEYGDGLFVVHYADGSVYTQQWINCAPVCPVVTLSFREERP